MLPENLMTRVIWTQDEPTIWRGELDGSFVVELILLGRSNSLQDARWIIIGGPKGERPSFGSDAYGTIEEATLEAGDLLLACANRILRQRKPL